MSRATRVVALLLGAAVVVLAGHLAVAEGGGEVVIAASGLVPPIVETALDERVTFVNRTGHPAHVEFARMPEGHQVFQVPGLIWARFHVAGRHPYVVHVDEGGRVRALRGAVNVTERRGPIAAPPICNGTTLGSATTEVCIER